MARDHINLGDRGERDAAQLLLRQGLQILEQNYRWSRAEVDIIAKSEKMLHFIEVKTRRYQSEEAALRSVGYKKQGNVMAAAGQYMLEVDYNGPFQFDIIIVLIDGQANKQVSWHKDAFGFFN